MTNEPQRRVAMSLLAHPDDAEMLCAGTLIRLADAGWEIHIATVANGDCGSTTLPRDGNRRRAASGRHRGRGQNQRDVSLPR